MKKGIILILLCSVVILHSCRNRTADGTNRRADIDTLLQQWQDDSLGCAGLRTAEMARTIYKKYDFKNKTSEEITKTLGKPNKVRDNGSQLSFTYYFGTKCSEGKIIDSIEHCSASFFYINTESKDCSLSTSCQ